MDVNRWRTALGPRAYAVGSIVAVLLGVPLIVFGGPAATTVGVILIIVSAISLLVSVGTYLDNGERDERDDERATS